VLLARPLDLPLVALVLALAAFVPPLAVFVLPLAVLLLACGIEYPLYSLVASYFYITCRTNVTVTVAATWSAQSVREARAGSRAA
jgi:hypothetical protein